MAHPIVPTIGRIVWYRPSVECDGDMVGVADAVKPDGQAFAAIVCRVWSETCVNLRIFDHGGKEHVRTSVLLVQPGSDRPDCGFCEWMPYQIGQASKPAA